MVDIHTIAFQPGSAMCMVLKKKLKIIQTPQKTVHEVWTMGIAPRLFVSTEKKTKIGKNVRMYY